MEYLDNIWERYQITEFIDFIDDKTQLIFDRIFNK